MAESSSEEIQEEANVNENSEIQREADKVLANKVLANEITKMLESSEHAISSECCIYRVPHDLRKLKDEAYTPQVLSIGPFHLNGGKRLEIMEKLKVRYFKRLVKKVALNVENLVSFIREREVHVCSRYAETIKLTSNNRVKMILLDASFIIVRFLIISKPLEWAHYEDFTAYTPRLTRDMWLIENQLPFFVIEELYNLAFPSWSCHPSFRQLAFRFFRGYNTQNFHPGHNLKIEHFTDLLRTFLLPQSPSQKQRDMDEKVMHLYTASQLDEAGVKFKVSSSKCLVELKFTNGVLEIPCLKLYDSTESLFRNILALEQCHYPCDHYFTDYVCIMDFLIDTTKDVDLLVRKKILVNRLGDNNAVTTLVNNLASEIFISDTSNYYSLLCKELNNFYEGRWHRWKATLRRDYLSTPWRTASTTAAIILLVLTLIQTVCSIMSVT